MCIRDSSGVLILKKKEKHQLWVRPTELIVEMLMTHDWSCLVLRRFDWATNHARLVCQPCQACMKQLWKCVHSFVQQSCTSTFWLNSHAADEHHCMHESPTAATVRKRIPVSDATLRMHKLLLTPLFMGAESCEKSESLQTFFATFLMYALYGSKKLRKKFGNFHFRQYWRDQEQKFANFLRCKCGRRKLHGGKNTGSGFGKIMNCSRGSHNPYSL